MITQAYIDFFEELAQNNQREWFQANKSRYEQEAKGPFLAMIQSVLDALNQEERVYPEEAKATLFRINRDVRFSKDKTPYHTILKASIVKVNDLGLAKKSAKPGIYLAADAQTLRIGGGLIKIDPKQLKPFRQYVADHIEELQQVISTNTFANTYKDLLKGESYKKPDAIAKSTGQESPYLLLKQFYYMQEYPIKGYLDQDLTNVIIEHIQAAKPVHQFLTKAIDFTQRPQQV
ncbi:hypothetical protein BKI52_36215 [marine bacterium AO1-C]|nr:hypothetical protein BKI52_36215 [marine bacterium AO1-C]